MTSEQPSSNAEVAREIVHKLETLPHIYIKQEPGTWGCKPGFEELAMEAITAALDAKDRKSGPEGDLSHDDVCRLSRAFNEGANLGTAQDCRINEWLKTKIAAAYDAKDREPAKAPVAQPDESPPMWQCHTAALEDCELASVAQPAERTVEEIARDCFFHDHGMPRGVDGCLTWTKAALRAERERTKAAVDHAVDHEVRKSANRCRNLIAGIETAEDERDSARNCWRALLNKLEAAERKCAEFEAALQPFALQAARYDPPENDGHQEAWDSSFKIDELRRADVALAGGTPHLDKLLDDVKREERERCELAALRIRDSYDRGGFGWNVADIIANEIRSLPLSPQEG